MRLIISVFNFKKAVIPVLRRIGVSHEDDEETRLRKSLLVITSILISIAGVIWGLIYIMFDEINASTIPIAYSVLSTINIVTLIFTKRFSFFRFIQLSLTLLLPFLVMAALGGFIRGSAVILWGLLAPIGALLCGASRNAKYWFVAFILTVIISGLVQPYLSHSNKLPDSMVYSFFIINITAVSSVIFVVINYFVKQKELVIQLMNKNRELEQAYLQQEITLRQSEKLATLGKLSAGIAHELNNPASAALSGAGHLNKSITELKNNNFKLGKMNLTEKQYEILKSLDKKIYDKSQNPDELSPLERNDLENELEAWLEGKGIEDCSDLASAMVNLSVSKDELNYIAENFSGEQFPVVVSSLEGNYNAFNLTEEIKHGSERIIQIVNALKSYTYLDRAPVQSVDIHEGIDNTLVMLRSRLKNIAVIRKYQDNLTRIKAYGSELNQVWTNILDNAIDAISGKGQITIKTYSQDKWIIVEIQDSGPGIPEEIESKVFDPFFTTKAPGQGTGLGLNISHSIITQKHNGEIKVKSRPGETCFQIKLPVSL